MGIIELLLVCRLDLGIQALNRQLDMERQTHRQSLSDLQRQLDFCRDHIQEMKDYTASYQALQQGKGVEVCRLVI